MIKYLISDASPTASSFVSMSSLVTSYTSINFLVWIYELYDMLLHVRPTVFFSNVLTFAIPTDSHVSSDLSLFTAPQRLISVLVMRWDM
jgi:hypothetical protein